MMLSILSCVCWPSVCLLCKNVYSAHLPIFNLDCLVFCCWILWVLYIFWILLKCVISDIWVLSSPIRKLVFLLCWWFPLLWRSFLVSCSPIWLFLLFVFRAWGDIYRKILLRLVSKLILPMFSSESLWFESYIQVFNSFWVDFYVWCETVV